MRGIVPHNGDHVTWRELSLALEPMSNDIDEIKGDVKLLLAANAGDEAVSSWQRWFFGLVMVGSSGAIITLVIFALGG